jgi:ATP-dependent protease HslVU (ClpYQ) peptidase subunit
VTTIAASVQHGCMAADSRVSGGSDLVTDREVKIRRINDCLVGTSGMTADGLLFAEWFNDHDLANRPSLDDDFQAIVLSCRGLFRYFHDCVPIRSAAVTYHAIGSGWNWALAAMDFGAAPAEAVRYAIRRDIASGGAVRVRRLAG